MSAVRMVAELMALSARTAPKSVGEDFVVTEIVEGDGVRELATEMAKYGQVSGKPKFDRDAASVRKSPVVLLIGIREAKAVGLNCGACGLEKCAQLQPREGSEFRGPQCALRLLDMGIALGSAVKMASFLNVDNRVMYRIGVVARKMGLVDADFVMGIPLSTTGKNIFFDR